MKLLKGLVIGMGVLIIAGMGLLAWGVYQKTGGRASAEGAQAFGHIPFDAGAGCEIADMKPAGDGLWLHIKGAAPECKKVVLIDLKAGQVLGTVGGAP